ncbi:MAG: helix-turn-helix domain-containing protein [Rhodopseudomonas palustris]|nr:helix-turn-helix domain-containing protein [Rhodopseudomonas palustris]
MVNATPFVTPAQVRAARAWLRWSQDDLSVRTGISKRSIARYEQEQSVPYQETVENLRRTFEAAGIEFQFVGMVGTESAHFRGACWIRN